MSFDPNVYAQIAAVDPAAAAQYLATTTVQAAAARAPAPVPQATFQPPNIIAQGFQQAQAAPQQAAARGTLEDFFNQPTGGGGPSVTSKFFNKRPQGSWLQLTVLADVTNADVQHQKTPQGILQYFKKNGQDDTARPKLVLVVKVQVTGSSDGTHVTEFPDGLASLWLKKGPVTDDLIRAMTAAGDPSGYPKAGAQMVMQSAGEQASRTVGFSATKLYTFQYAAPAGGGDPTSPVPSVPQAAPIPPVPTSPAASAPAPVNPAPAPAPSIPTPAMPAAPAPSAAPTASAPSAAPAPAPVNPAPAPVPVIGDDKAALLARLQGMNA